MEKQIIIDGVNVKYLLKISKKARKIRLSVYYNGNFTVTIPHRIRENEAERFILKKSKWIITKITYFKNSHPEIILENNKNDYKIYKEKALTLAKERVYYFNKIYGFKFNKIFIKNQKTRWGSCSRKGNINFNYKIALLPEKLADYIIVHEICHLGEFNHSQSFWDLVIKTTPDYLEIGKELKKSLYIF